MGVLAACDVCGNLGFLFKGCPITHALLSDGVRFHIGGFEKVHVCSCREARVRGCFCGYLFFCILNVIVFNYIFLVI